MDRTTLRPTPRQSRQPGQLRSGLRYVAGTPDLLAPLLVLTVVGTFIFVWSVTLPIYARDVFQGRAETFGLMFSAMGVGAIVGGLAVAGFLVPTMRWFAAMGALLGTLTIVCRPRADAAFGVDLDGLSRLCRYGLPCDGDRRRAGAGEGRDARPDHWAS